MLQRAKSKVRALAVGFFAACLVAPMGVLALDITQKITLPVSSEYDSNPRMAETDKQSVWRYTINPRYNISAVQDASQWYLDAALRYQRSSDPDVSIYREDPTVELGWNRDYSLGRFGVYTRYAKQSTRFTEFDGTGLVLIDGSSKDRVAGANWTHFWTERLNSAIGVTLNKREFSEGSDLRDFLTRGATFQLSYIMTDRLTSFVQAGVTDFRPQNNLSNRSISRNVSLGANYLLDPNTNLSGAVGVNDVSTVGNGWIANFSANHDRERHHYRASFARAVSAAGVGNFQESDRYALGYVFDWSERSRIGADYSHRRNNSLNDVKTQQLTGWFSRNLTEFWDVRLSLQHRKLESTNRDAEADQIGFSVIYNMPEF